MTHTFRVWAPRAREVTLKLGRDSLPMSGPDEHGWWKCEVANAATGANYAFCLDDDPKPYPDPRSLFQPDGVHGRSHLYDHDAFHWTDAEFQARPLARGIVYEMHIGTFTPEGTLDAAIEKLDTLAELGVTHVELMPVAAFAGDRGWGYDGVALFAVHATYGGPDALKRFVDAAHAKELAVLLDVVYNHFGPVGNYTAKFGSYIDEAHRTPWGGAVNLESRGAMEVRRFLCDDALMWLRDFHIDGLRLDAVHAMVDRSAIHFLEQLSAEVKALAAATGRELVLIAESDLNDPRIVTVREAGGYGIDAQWSDDFHHALFSVLNPRPAEGYYSDFGALGQLAKAIEKVFVYDGIYSRYRDRVQGREVENLPRHRFLGFIQNHDQVGNRAVGDRVREIAGFARAKIAAAVVLMSPFVPLLFQGEEWAASSPFQYFADHDDPEMARLVSQGRKREFEAFGWDPAMVPDPEAPETFARSKLKWEEREAAEHGEMLEWYRALIRLRRTTPCLNDDEPGQARVTWSETERWLAMTRDGITLIFTVNSSEIAFPVAEGARVVLASPEGIELRDGSVHLTADSVVILGQGRSK